MKEGAYERGGLNRAFTVSQKGSIFEEVLMTITLFYEKILKALYAILISNGPKRMMKQTALNSPEFLVLIIKKILLKLDL